MFLTHTAAELKFSSSTHLVFTFTFDMSGSIRGTRGGTGSAGSGSGPSSPWESVMGSDRGGTFVVSSAQLRQKQRRAHSSIFWSLSKCTSMLLQKVTQVNRVVLPVCCTRRPASHHATSTASLPTRTSRLVTQSMESLQTRVRRIPPRSGFAFASTWGGCCRLPPLLQNPTLAFFFLSSPLYIFTNLLRKKSCFRKRN